MTEINRIVKEIKEFPDKEWYGIRSNKVRQIAEHCRQLHPFGNELSIDEIEKQIRTGQMKIMGRPVKVLP